MVRSLVWSTPQLLVALVGGFCALAVAKVGGARVGVLRRSPRGATAQLWCVNEHGDVSHVRLRFLERRASDYLIRVTALAHAVFNKPVELVIDTWISRLPDGRYGAAVEPMLR